MSASNLGAAHMLGTLHKASHLTFTAQDEGKSYDSHFVNEETEAQTGEGLA